MALDFTGMRALNRPYARRLEEAKKLLQVVEAIGCCSEEMRPKDAEFLERVMFEASDGRFPTGEGELAWLRDIVARYT